MTYDETVAYLYRLLPDYQRTGEPAGKIDLAKTHALLAAMGDPHLGLRVIHVGGTNGKGTVSHLLASFATASGLRAGLYTSPHYVDFRERIRIDGQVVDRDRVVAFVAEHRGLIERVRASFFEFTVAMAFAHFAAEEVDLAVIEVGLGGRLDSTNVIAPDSLLAAVVTNIGLDHTEFLGDTRAAIAREKAGIFKSGRPAIVGVRDAETWPVFASAADAVGAHLSAAEDLVHVEPLAGGGVALTYRAGSSHTPWRRAYDEVGVNGPFALENLRTATLAWIIAARELRPDADDYDLPPARGVAEPEVLSGYRGRFLYLGERPTVIADAGHNVEAWGPTARAVAEAAAGGRIFVVCGFVRGKDHAAFFGSFPARTRYFVGAPDLPRAVPAAEVVAAAHPPARFAEAYPDVPAAYDAALAAADDPGDTIFVGGSTFVVGALLEHLERSRPRETS